MIFTKEDIGMVVMTSEGLGKIDEFRVHQFVAFPVVVRIGSVSISFTKKGKDLNGDYAILNKLPKETNPEYYL